MQNIKEQFDYFCRKRLETSFYDRQAEYKDKTKKLDDYLRENCEDYMEISDLTAEIETLVEFEAYQQGLKDGMELKDILQNEKPAAVTADSQ